MADLDSLGPYTIPQLRSIARNAGCPEVSVIASRGNHHLILDSLSRGKPVVVLWLQTPTFGHYVLLHLVSSRGKPGIEFFDPLGTDNKEKSWQEYMDDPRDLNSGAGEERGLRSMLQGFHEAGIPLSYNQPSNGPQHQNADSCGLWCLLRAAVPGLTPSRFAAEFRDKP